MSVKAYRKTLFWEKTPERKSSSEMKLPLEIVHKHSDCFSDERDAVRYLKNIWYPKSKNWSYPLNGKAGNTFTLDLLFEIEFGFNFTSVFNTPANHHPDFAVFQQMNAGLLTNPVKDRLSLNEFETLPGVRIATVRNPFKRAVSSFRYFCRSHQFADQRFSLERVRINALEGFDWGKDPLTAIGFKKFVRYVYFTKEALPRVYVDAHWAPQTWNIQPDIFAPNLIGKVEDMSSFATAVRAELASEQPAAKGEGRKNKSDYADRDVDYFADAEVSQMLRQIYESDFERFEYETSPT